MSCTTKKILPKLRASIIFGCLTLGVYANFAQADSERSTIVLFGDSITVGINHLTRGVIDGTPSGNTVNSPGQQGVPTIFMQDKMDSTRRNAVVANWGYGGSSSEFGVNRISGNLSTTKSQYPSGAYFVLIMYGTNDFGQNISSSTTGFNVQQMVNKAVQAGYLPVVGTLTPRSDEDVQPANFHIRNVSGAQIVDHYNRFYNSNNPTAYQDLLDFETLYAGSENEQQGYLHPTNEGYQVITDLWFDEALKQLIESGSPVIIPAISILLLDD